MGFYLQQLIKHLRLDGQTFLTNSGHAPGWGLPAAIGAYYSEN